jgi:hypothetical protein
MTRPLALGEQGQGELKISGEPRRPAQSYRSPEISGPEKSGPFFLFIGSLDLGLNL